MLTLDLSSSVIQKVQSVRWFALKERWEFECYIGVNPEQLYWLQCSYSGLTVVIRN